MTAQSLQPVLDFVLRERGWEPSPRLSRLATHLPPVVCAGFELHLRQDHQVDLQQRVKSPTEWARLRRFLRERLPPQRQGSWETLARFCDRADAEALADELWLELDDDAARGLPPLSIFARLPETARASGSVAESEIAIARLLAAFATDLSRSAQDALRLCLEACRDGAGPSHIGMMLGRSQTPLRLLVEQIPAADFGGFLERAGLGHRAEEVQKHVDALFVYADRIRLALTLTDRLDDTIGLECFVGDPTTHEPRWRQLFDHLLHVGGLCKPDLHRRLVDWPMSILPHQTREGWPGALIAQALGEGAKKLSWLDCRTSHVKLSLGGAGGGSAKAYIGFLQETRDLRPPPARDACTASFRPRAAGWNEVLAAASDALLRARNQAGWWLDYPGFGEGVSDEWVTAYVANACSQVGAPPLRDAAARAWLLLSGRMRDGWGWNFVQPPDADSTAWALRLAQSLDRLSEPRAQKGLAFLKRHIGVDGGVATYLPDSHAARFPDLAINDGWHRTHLCVTAAVAGLAPLAAAPRAHLLQGQEADGTWRSYWWADHAYATAMAAAALSASPAACAATARAARWAHERLRHDASLRDNPFALALTLRTALLLDDADAALLQQGADDLAARQRADGMWTGSAVLRIPNSAGAFSDATDRHGIFTTATVLVTLAALRRAGGLP